MRTEAAVEPGARIMRADARRNRDRILAGAREAFAEYGSETQMDDIARRAGVGVGTLYRHFPTKDALTSELVKVKLTTFAARARAKFEEDERPFESFADLLREQTEVMQADASQQRMIFAMTKHAMEQVAPTAGELERGHAAPDRPRAGGRRASLRGRGGRRSHAHVRAGQRNGRGRHRRHALRLAAHPRVHARRHEDGLGQTRRLAIVRCPMRRSLPLLALPACLLAIVLPGCGGDDDSSGPLDAGLAYLPADSPFAVAIDTDLDGDQYKALDSILGRFPFGDKTVKELIADQLADADSGVNFEQDVEPVLGNPFVVGALDVASFVGDEQNDDFVAALESRRRGRARQPGGRERREGDG